MDKVSTQWRFSTEKKYLFVHFYLITKFGTKFK